MATVAAIQAELDPSGYGTKARIVKQNTITTTDYFYVTGGVDYPGKAKWCTTTNTDSAATQAAAIQTQMAA